MAILLIIGVISAVAVGIFLISDTESEAPLSPVESRIPTVGLLLPADYVATFLKIQMEALGYIEGENIHYEVVVTTDPSNYAEGFQTLIDKGVDVIVCNGAQPVVEASKATTTIPIVFTAKQDQFIEIIDPIIRAQGVDTNLTGVIVANAAQKRFELLMAMDPSIKNVYFPYDPTDALSTNSLALTQEVAARYGVTLQTHEFSGEAENLQAMESIPANADAVLLGEELPSLVYMAEWATTALQQQSAMVISFGQFNEGLFPSNVLMGYGGGVEEQYRTAAQSIDQLLRGVRAADLPPRPTDIYLTVNLGAAEALGIEVPDEVLSQAEQILRETVSTPESAAPIAGDNEAVACNTILETPLGANEVCITQACSTLLDLDFARYTNRAGVDTCSTEGVLGICSTSTGDAYFYSGQVTAVEAGCATNGGEWIPSASS